ncbi:MAG: hypothetical protein HBSAPP03_00530 [Phycisphaerae bacterium]|nr:MAG: hypothetical protein HBSAPP03_00530 [Phycisphaerae bacterium]
MTDGLILAGLLAGATLIAFLGLITARVLGLPGWVARQTATHESRYELFIGLLGLVGLLGALTLLMGFGLTLGISTTAAAVLLLVCAGGLSMALRPAPERSTWTMAPAKDAKSDASKAA